MTKKLVVFDLDGTLITGNTWEDLNTALGVSEKQDWDLYSAFSKGEITYEEWLSELHNLYNLQENRHSKGQVLEYLTQYELATGGKEAIADINASGHDTLLLTGSFQMTADAVAFELGIKEAIATTKCVFDDDGHLERLESAGNERQAKVAILSEYRKERSVELSDCVVVGDGGNMIALFGLVEQSVAFETSSDEVKRAASNVINSIQELPNLVQKL
jgi:HAD superfamily phosphoserine phosphatase-like hydrolase